MRNPFLLFDWKKPFFQELLPYLFSFQQDTGVYLEDIALIFPHGRAKKYFLYALEESSFFPCISPALYTIQEYISEIAYATVFNKSAPYILSLHEEIYLMQKVLFSLEIYDSSLQASLEKMSSKESFMWAWSILPIVNALYTHSSFPKEYFFEIEENLHPFAHKILFFLKDIYLAYTSFLEENAYTTKSHMLFKVAQHCKNASFIEKVFPHKVTMLAGHAILSGSEENIIKNLWSNSDFHIVLHTDPFLSTAPTKANNFTKLQKKWIDSWSAETRVYNFSKKDSSTNNIQIYECTTIHSEIESITSIINEIGTKNTVIIPTDSNLLIPLLHSLSMQNINVSLGYPLKNSSFSLFLEYSFSAQENKNEKGYYCKDILNAIKYFIHSIIGSQEKYKEHTTFLMDFLGYIQKQKKYYIDIEILYKEYSSEDSLYEEKSTFLHNVLHFLFFIWEKQKTPNELALSLKEVLNFLYSLQKGYLSALDFEAYVLYINNIIPKLFDGIIAKEQWDKQNSFYILKEYISQETIVFKEESKDSLQIVGLLEARLMPFKNLIILDAVEGSLPTITKENPLIPESIYSKLCFIPDSFQKNILTGYNFFRLINTAENVHIFYRKNIAKGIGETVTRSRFVEEIIWSFEREQGILLSEKKSNNFFHIMGTRSDTLKFLPENTVHKTDTIRNFITLRLEKGVSATMFSTYLSCPFKWAQKYIFFIQEDVTENLDISMPPHLLGEAIHYALEKYFRPFIGIYSRKEDFFNKEDEILMHVYDFFVQKSYPLPIDIRIMLKNTLRKQITLFLEKQAETFTIISLEKEYRAYLGTIPLFGRIDRIELRENMLHIIDYKTGKKIAKNAFSKEMRNLFDTISYEQNTVSIKSIEKIMQNATQNIQLYMYLYLVMKNEKDFKYVNAKFIFLGESPPVEHSLFIEKDSEDYSESIETITIERLEKFFSIIIDDMINFPVFEKRKDLRKCSHCAYKLLCF